MTAQPEINMPLDEIIQKRIKEDKGKRPLLNKRRRRFLLRKKYNEENSKKDNRRRIRVENLNKEMQNPDLVKLFEEYGKLTRCGIKFDKMGASRGIADIEFSTHEECENAINKLDNAEINAPILFGKFNRRRRSAGNQRRNLRRFNRSNRRGGLRFRNRRLGRRTRLGDTRRQSYRPKRRFFRRTLGRRRRQEKKQN